MNLALDSPSPELPEKACAITATLHQEKGRFDNLLKIVHSSLKSLIGALRGEILINKSLEEISHSIMRNKVPKEWLVRKSLSIWQVFIVSDNFVFEIIVSFLHSIV